MSYPEFIPDMLKQRRIKLGLSLSRVARRASTSAASISRYENGWDRFEIATLRRLAAALGCRLDVRLIPRNTQASVKPLHGIKRLRRLFWDRGLTERDLQKHPRWIVGRVVEHGDLQDIRILAGMLGTAKFLELTEEVRFSSAKAAAFWRNIRKMEGIQCAKKPCRPAAGQSWRP